MKVKGAKVAALLALLTCVVVQSASAQIVEALYFGASVVANKAIADSQRGVISSCQLVFNVYLEPEGEGEARYVNSWYPANGTAAWFGDRIVLEVVPVKNGPPSRDLQLYLNHQLLKGKCRKVGKEGVEGGYPRLWVGADLLMGANTLTVRFSSKEFATTVIQRADLVAFRRILADGNALRQLAGSAPTAFPSAPICSAIVDGKLEVFASPEEAQAAIQMLNAPPSQNRPPPVRVRPPAREKARRAAEKKVEEPAQPKPPRSDMPAGTAKPPRSDKPERDSVIVQPPVELPTVEVRLVAYEPAQKPTTAFLREKLEESTALSPEDLSVTVTDGGAMAFQFISPEPFTVLLMDGEKVVSSATVSQVGGVYEALVRLVFDRPPTRHLLIKQGERQRVIKFKFKQATRRVAGGEM